ncbi:MAG: hypothetical protein ACI9Y1_002308 [Lentisphaeria bacterium]|jgi:hypothetical protein
MGTNGAFGKNSLTIDRMRSVHLTGNIPNQTHTRFFFSFGEGEATDVLHGFGKAALVERHAGNNLAEILVLYFSVNC